MGVDVPRVGPDSIARFTSTISLILLLLFHSVNLTDSGLGLVSVLSVRTTLGRGFPHPKLRWSEDRFPGDF